jgi:hypothetical protein
MVETKPITQREAGLLSRFGFQLVKGRTFEKVFYDSIKSVQPAADGLLIEYVERLPLLSSLASVVMVDVPRGIFTTGEQKDLDSAWIFVYYTKIIDTSRDGTVTER